MVRKLNLHKLDFDKSYKYTVSSLYESNKLCSILFDVIDFSLGRFFVPLPDNASIERVYEFKSKDLILPTVDEIASFLFMKKGGYEDLSYIFDDSRLFWLDRKSDFLESSFFLNYGVLYDYSFSRIKAYYVLTGEDVSFELIKQSMLISKNPYHSLCVLTKADLNNLKDKKLDDAKIQGICRDIKLMMIGAYNGGGYIFWETKS